MGGGLVGNQVTIPSVFMRRSDGLAMVAHYNANPTTAAGRVLLQPAQQARTRATSSPGSARAGRRRTRTSSPTSSRRAWTSSRAVTGPGRSRRRSPASGRQSGTSMATPHVAGPLRCCSRSIRGGRRAMVKSALMTTATEQVFTTTARTTLAGVLDRGAGRIDLTKAGDPGLIARQAEPQRPAHVRRARRSRSEFAHGTSVARTTPGTSPRSRPVTPRRPRTSTSRPDRPR